MVLLSKDLLASGLLVYWLYGFPHRAIRVPRAPVEQREARLGHFGKRRN